ncbi:MAG: 3-oxoacyl-[acyl-carrier-protein] reductase [Brevinemataceae bacterium]
MRGIKGKNAVITGSSQGIGLAIAHRLAKEGANIVLSSSSISEDSILVEEFRKKYSVNVMAIAADVSDFHQVEYLMNHTWEQWGSVDILVNNAGITKDNLILRMPIEDFSKVLDVHLKGVFYGIKSVYPIMMKQRSGKIINMSSVIGIIGNVGQANYAAAKAGIIALTKSTAKELAGRGVNVNAIAPGFINTAMTDAIPENEKNKIMNSIPMKRMAESEEIASVVAFLASEEASYITGQTIVVDGGMVM